METLNDDMDLEQMVIEGEMRALSAELYTYPHLIDWRNGDGDTMAHIAAQHGRSEVILLLWRLNYNFNKPYNPRGYLPIHTACHYNHLDCIIALRLAGADLNMTTQPDKMTPLHICCRHGCVQIIRMLIRNGANSEAKDAYGHLPINKAEWHGARDAVDYLWKREQALHPKCAKAKKK